MSKVAVIGAGKTGRGFIGRLLQEAQQKIIFVDHNAELICKMRSSGVYHIRFFGRVRQTYKIDNYEAYTWKEVSFEDVDLIIVSVGGQNLKDVGKELKKHLNKKKHYYIITAENASNPAETLKHAIEQPNVSISESTVFCTTIEDGELDISSENYPYLQCNAELLDGYVPAIKTLKLLDHFSDFLTRKLYTYNAASCVIAYLGWQKGYTDYAEAANDKEILELLDKNYKVTNRVLCKEYGYAEADQEEFAALSKRKFCDRTIHDTIARNARDPKRKLSRDERIFGPIALLYKYGEDASVLEQTAAAAILYNDEADEEWKKLKEEKTEEEILRGICGVEKESKLFYRIMTYIEKIKKQQIS